MAADDRHLAEHRGRAPIPAHRSSAPRRGGLRRRRRRSDRGSTVGRARSASRERSCRRPRSDRGRRATADEASAGCCSTRPSRGRAARASGSSSSTCSRGTRRRFGCTRRTGSCARAIAAVTTGVTTPTSTRSSWRTTSLRHRNPLHLERPDQEAPHLRLVARVEQGVAADEAAGRLHRMDELRDRRSGLRASDRERDPPGRVPERHRWTRIARFALPRCRAPSSPSRGSSMRTRCPRTGAVSVPTSCRMCDGRQPRTPRATAQLSPRPRTQRARPSPAPRAPAAPPPPRAGPHRAPPASRTASGRARSRRAADGAGRRPSTRRSSDPPRPGRPNGGGAPRRATRIVDSSSSSSPSARSSSANAAARWP